MQHPLRSSLTLACLAALVAASGAHAQGITDIMRTGPRVAVPPAPPARPATSPPVQRAAEYIVALVNSEPITNTEVQKRIQRVLEEGGAEVQRMPREQLLREVLEQLISERAQLQLAKESGIRADEPAIDQGEQMVARQNQISVEELRRRVAGAGMTQREFRDNIRNQLLLTRLRERELEPKGRVSDLEVDQFLQDQRTGAGAGAPARELHLAQVLVAVPENAPATQVATLQKRAEDIAQRARAGEDFTRLASELSDAPERASGGSLGLRSADRYPSLFVEATQSTAVGGIAGPVRSGAGFHVLKVIAKGDAAADGVTVAQTQVRHILIRPDAQRSTEQVIAQLNDFKRRLENGTAEFAGLARDNSQDGSAANGGELGWATAGQFVPEFEEAMNRLAPGQVSDPVISRFGVHLIQVQGRRETRLSAEEQREMARSALREKKMEDAYEAWAQEVRARAYVELRDPPQ